MKHFPSILYMYNIIFIYLFVMSQYFINITGSLYTLKYVAAGTIDYSPYTHYLAREQRIFAIFKKYEIVQSTLKQNTGLLNQ